MLCQVLEFARANSTTPRVFIYSDQVGGIATKVLPWHLFPLFLKHNCDLLEFLALLVPNTFRLTSAPQGA